MNKLTLLGIVGMALCLIPLSATATTISFSPASQMVAVGDTVSVDVVVSDLAGEIISAYDLDVTYDASVLSATNVSFGSLLGDETLWEVLNDSDLTTPGIADFAQVSLLSDAELAALQPGDSFTLATLEFQAIGSGTSPLDFVLDANNDIKGFNNQPLEVNPESGSVGPIPEPHSALLYALGVLLFGAAIPARSSATRTSHPG